MDLNVELESFGSSSSTTRPSSSSNKNKVVGKDLLISFVICMSGWFGPKVFFLPSPQEIASRPAPYQTTAAGDVILDFELDNPLVEPQTISPLLLYYTGAILPVLLVGIVGWQSSNRHEFQAAVAGAMTNIGLSETVTQLIKYSVQRRRPNFYALCGWSLEQRKCTADFDKQVEAQLSFPSGHSSLTFGAMTFLALYFLGRVGLQRKNYSVTARILALSCCIIPGSWAFAVASSRVIDHWHHPSDVVAGALLGILSAMLSYHTCYPSVFSSSSGVPLASVPLDKLPSISE